MKTFETTDEILDFAMSLEQEAVDFYLGLAGESSNAQMKEVFEGFAREEVGHKAKLQKIKEEKLLGLEAERVSDLKIADYVVEYTPGQPMDYADALLLAMKKEKAAFKLYLNLSQRTQNPVLRQTFEALAAEESKHKLRFEIEYDEYVLKEN
jgi:rubrerythrin